MPINQTEDPQEVSNLADLQHTAAVQTTNEAMRRVRRSMDPNDIHDLLDAIEDERMAADERRSADLRALTSPIMQLFLDSKEGD